MTDQILHVIDSILVFLRFVNIIKMCLLYTPVGF